MLSIKPGVRIHGLSSEILLAIYVAESVFIEQGYDCVITSLVEGHHSENSLHYAGNAVDLRNRHLPTDLIPIIAEKIREALGKDYDVVIETTHFHIEYQPGRQS